jgi:hypothetical protein
MNYSEMEQELRSLREKVTIYEATLQQARLSEERMTQSENRLLSTVHWTLGTVIIITFTAIAAVVGLNWWINEKVYTRDKQALHSELVELVNNRVRELSKDHIGAMKQQFKDLETRLSQQQNLSFANAFIKDADMRQNILDVEGALRSAILAFGKMREISSPNWADVLERMDVAIRRATTGQKHIPELLLLEVDKAVDAVERTKGGSTDQTLKLKETLKLHRDKLGS